MTYDIDRVLAGVRDKFLGHMIVGTDGLEDAIHRYIERSFDWPVEEIRIDGSEVSIRLAPRSELIEISVVTGA